jgi:chromosome segregation protein
MIFAGSEQRARSGMASATITFDNNDGWLPIDFTEVTVSRRAYRSGENEYLLNGQRVRLRDVAELLARCGLGERTYTIIGQGLVDAALSLKAEERRRLFEEAAGIGLYRSQRRIPAASRSSATSIACATARRTRRACGASSARRNAPRNTPRSARTCTPPCVSGTAITGIAC